MAVLTTICIIFTCIVLLLLWLKLKLSYWKKRGLESPSFLHLLTEIKKTLCHEESVIDRDTRAYQWIKSRGLKHGGMYKMWRRSYEPVDLEIIKHILQTDFDHFFDRGMYINEEADPMSTHLFNLNGKKWKLLRNKLSPTFSSGRMKMMFDIVVDCTDDMKSAMDDKIGEPIDIKDITGSFTIDVIANCAFGLKCNSLYSPNCEFKKRVSNFFSEDFYLHLKQMLIIAFPNLMKILNAQTINDDITDFFMKLTKETIEYREKNDIRSKDFLDLMIQLKNKGRLIDDEDKKITENVSDEDNKITVEEIAAQCLLFFSAGFATSSAAMAFCLYELAKSKDIQDNARREIKDVLLNYGGKLTYEALNEMKYLGQIINETLRKYPPEPSLLRICTKNYHIPNSDVVLEKGTHVLIHTVALQRDPDNYPEPEKFDPNRFTEENIRARPACSFLPFGQGPRHCIGLRFALMQTKIAIIALLLNYEFSPCDRMKEPLKFDHNSLTMVIDGGIWINFSKISP